MGDCREIGAEIGVEIRGREIERLEGGSFIYTLLYENLPTPLTPFIYALIV